MNDKTVDTAIGDNNKPDRLRNKLEVINTLILAIATLSVTWSSYQGALWNGIQTFKLADSNKFNRLAHQKTILLGQNRAMDEAIIISFVNAVIEKKQKIVDYALRSLRPELSKIMSTWLSSQPIENPSAYPHPMAMPEYTGQVKKDMAESDKLTLLADEARTKAQEANNNSDNYSLLTVVFSMVMFFGAITSKIASPRLRLVNNIITGTICIAALVILFFLMPITTG